MGCILQQKRENKYLKSDGLYSGCVYLASIPKSSCGNLKNYDKKTDKIETCSNTAKCAYFLFFFGGGVGQKYDFIKPPNIMNHNFEKTCLLLVVLRIISLYYIKKIEYFGNDKPMLLRGLRLYFTKESRKKRVSFLGAGVQGGGGGKGLATKLEGGGVRPQWPGH